IDGRPDQAGGGGDPSCFRSDQDSLDFVQRDLIVTAVVKGGGGGTLVISHLLRAFKPAAIARVFGNACSAEGVAADFGFDAGSGGTAADHAVDIGLAHRPLRKAAGANGYRGKKPCFGISPGLGIFLRSTACLKVIVQIAIELVMAG